MQVVPDETAQLPERVDVVSVSRAGTDTLIALVAFTVMAVFVLALIAIVTATIVLLVWLCTIQLWWVAALIAFVIFAYVKETM